MAAGSKKFPKQHGAGMTGRRSASASPVPPTLAASPSGRRKTQVRSRAIDKQRIAEPARGRVAPRRKAKVSHRADRTDSALSVQLDTIPRDLGQIADMRAELADLRAIIEELVQTVAVLTDSQAQGDNIEQPAGGTGEVLVVETYGVSADEEEPEPQGVAQG
jgi:hypothetical protein